MRRRHFLQATAATSLSLGGGVLLGGGSARADDVGWGDYPTWAKSAELPVAKRAKRVLEIFLKGGLCPWESFYAIDREDYGQATKQMWWTFQEGPNGVPALFAACGGAGPLLRDFRVDELGTMVKLGPFAEPLRSRKDIVERLRLHVISHDVYPHDPAVALALTGARVGSPRLAGLGAAIQRHALAHAAGPSAYPYAYVLPTKLASIDEAGAVGRHPPSCRPLVLKSPEPGSGEGMFDLAGGLSSDDAEANALATYYEAKHTKRLLRPGRSVPVRSPALGVYESAGQQIAALTALGKLLGPGDFAAPAGDSCGLPYTFDRTRQQLRLAAKLLTHPGSVARHVIVGDSSFAEDTLMPDGYDFHDNYARKAAAKLPYFWTRLLEIINQPGENDPQKIDLADTLVMVNTEFGRSPGTQAITGRNHHPSAYITFMFGGPVGPDQQGIVGAIDKNAAAFNPLTPAATRAALLVALGIYPFQPDTFAYSDIGGVGSELEGALKLKETVLGVTT